VNPLLTIAEHNLRQIGEADVETNQNRKTIRLSVENQFKQQITVR
jgi:hypothetical protein